MPAKPRADRSLPTGTVTFLFTDIEGSTRLWETQHAAMQLALAHHDAIICDAIEGNDGYLAACCCRQMSASHYARRVAAARSIGGRHRLRRCLA